MRIKTCCLKSEYIYIYLNYNECFQNKHTYYTESKSTYIYVFKIMNILRFPLTKKCKFYTKQFPLTKKLKL